MTEPEYYSGRQVYAELTAKQSDFARHSILSREVISQMDDEQIKKNNIVADMLIFGLCVLVIGLASVTDQFAVIKDGVKRIDYIPRMPYLISYVVSVAICIFLAYYTEGSEGLGRLFNRKNIFANLPMVVTSCIGDVVVLRINVALDPALWKVINQLRLLLTVAASRLVFNQRISVTQYCTLFGTFWAVLAYVSRGLTQIVINDYFILFIGICVIFMNVAAGIHNELTMRRINDTFPIMFGQNRLAGLSVSLAILPFELWATNSWHKFPFGEFHRGVWIMTLFETIKVWLIVKTMTKLGSVYRTLALSLGLFVTYLASSFLLPTAPPFNMSQFTIITAMAMCVIGYSTARIDAERVYDLTAEKANKLADEKEEP
ncbi:putative transmembrane protein [Gregarina niphandrodes]|uniref:Transmembrane protein n=1 Tax=Gregarina niphandrodes TaxID=110365 RepID=A0A023BDN8_GRENI|nr:putative transmembrane protein [Gregarina niphandrodes]EZG89665.1 putative transmembrane protein [Gregarina niphandrodes]|eukprot:XP_011128471.1 putative transmembrane protein [Gregarina niphandrodes]